MKITKSKFKKIIREEIQKLNEKVEFVDSKGTGLQLGDELKLVKRGFDPSHKKGTTVYVIGFLKRGRYEGATWTVTDKNVKSLMKWPISDWGDTNEEPIAITLPDIIIKTGHDSQLFKKIERIPNTDSPYAVKAAKEVIKKDKVAQRRLRKPDPYKRRGHSRA